MYRTKQLNIKRCKGKSCNYMRLLRRILKGEGPEPKRPQSPFMEKSRQSMTKLNLKNIFPLIQPYRVYQEENYNPMRIFIPKKKPHP